MRIFVENQVRVGITKHEGINVSFGSVSTRVLNVFANLSCEKRGIGIRVWIARFQPVLRLASRGVLLEGMPRLLEDCDMGLLRYR